MAELHGFNSKDDRDNPGMEEYRRKAMQLDVEQFATLFEHLFLVRVPESVVTRRPTDVSPLDFRTQMLRLSRSTSDVNLGEVSVFEVVKKKPGRPFPERISIGRAPNCDITIRVPFVSKLHAYFMHDPKAGLQLVDNKSANGTWVAAERLHAGRPHSVGVGARIKLGVLELELLDARLVHSLLRSIA